MKQDHSFTFIDLFAGIGGFHIAMKNLGGTCVFASEWDENCRKVYTYNFSKDKSPIFNFDGTPNENFCGDITKVEPQSIPEHDILCAGFPCQPFSQAGQRRGFEDTRGTLFFNVAAIIKTKKPKVFFLENVRGLLTHDSGHTFEVISNTIKELGYSFHYKIIKASDFNLPQHRPRLYMVGIREDLIDTFSFPNPVPLTMTMSDIFEGHVDKKIGFTLRVGGKGSPLNDRRNWDGYLVDGVEKRLQPREAKKMQGFPEEFEFNVSNNTAMKQLGNSVAVPAIQAVGKELINVLNANNM